MKYLALSLVLLATCAVQAQLSDADLSRMSKKDIADTLRHIIKNERQAIERADAAVNHAVATTQALREATKANTELAAALEKAKASAAKVEADRDAQQVRAESEHKRAEKEAKESARRGNVIGILGAAALCFLALQLMRFIPFPYSLAAPVLAAPAGYFLARLII